MFSITSDASEKLTTYGSIASKRLIDEATPLNDSIAKLAEKNDLNPNQVKRVVESANMVTHMQLFKTAKDKNIHFDLADATVILANMNSEVLVKTASFNIPDVIPEVDYFKNFGIAPDDEEEKIASRKMNQYDLLVMQEKLALAKQMLSDEIIMDGMKYETAKDELYKIAKQMIADRQIKIGDIVKLAVDKYTKPVHQAVHAIVTELAETETVKLALEEAPNELISEAVADSTTVYNGIHPLLIKMDTLQQKGDDVVKHTGNLTNVEEKLKDVKQQIKEV